MMPRIRLSDPTLRDGNHAVKHKITLHQIEQYTALANRAQIDIVEVGHGCGLGASSLQFGLSDYSDAEMLHCARRQLTHSLLGVHIIPGIGRTRDIDIAIDAGVDIFRVGCHCTEADTTLKMIQYLASKQLCAYGVLMMTHMANPNQLVTQARMMADAGANAIILMDSAGALLPPDVTARIEPLCALKLPIGFHAHNNLEMAVANSIAAANAGATIIDGTARGFGPGAGNTPLEVIAALLKKLSYQLNINDDAMMDLATAAESFLIEKLPTTSIPSLTSGLYGVFSGFTPHVEKAAKQFDVSMVEIFKALGKRKAIAGQEDMIIKVAKQLQGITS